MNVEKVHKLANDIVTENSKLGILDKFQSMIDDLQNIISQPNQPHFQNNLATTLKELKGSLQKSLTNTLSPAWYQMLVDLEIDDIMGNNLDKRIENIFAKNQITPATAKQELEEIFNKLTNKYTGFSNIVNGLKSLNIGYDELEENVCEIGFLIPRDFIENNIECLAREIKEINFILNSYSELIIGSKSKFEIRSLSTTDPLITISVITAIAAGVAKTISWLIDNYKKLLEIKKLHQEIKKQGVPEKDLKGIAEYSNTHMNTSIEKIIESVSNEYTKVKDITRKNELLNGIRIALYKIANRIDRGYNIEVRINTKYNPENKEDTENNKYKEEIIKASEHLQFMKLTGEPILSLSEIKYDKSE